MVHARSPGVPSSPLVELGDAPLEDRIVNSDYPIGDNVAAMPGRPKRARRPASTFRHGGRLNVYLEKHWDRLP